MDDMARPKQPGAGRAQMRDIANQLHGGGGELVEGFIFVEPVHFESHNGHILDVVPRVGPLRNKHIAGTSG